MGLFSYAQSLLDYGNRLAYNRVQGSNKQPTKNMTNQNQPIDKQDIDNDDNFGESLDEIQGANDSMEEKLEALDDLGDFSGASNELGYANDR